jgi:hypothetical protein
MKARCVHGSPWYVECWSCADEVIAEHHRKVVNFDLARNRIAHRMQGVHHQEYLVRMWPRGCEPQPLPPGVHEFDGVPFFSSAQGPTTTFDMTTEPLTLASFLRTRTDIWRRLFGRHLRSVK